jgi:3-deoxy-manno-octulosonate cytidylyltransferase (CMP-KDO synthetase)
LSGGDAVAILPVRVDSRRLPRKALLAETGRPLFLHTWERAREASAFAAVYIATDSPEVADAARAAGAQVIMTGSRPRTGSERCSEAAAELHAEFIVDVQGDWPEVDPRDLDRLVEALRKEDIPVATLAVPLDGPGDAERAQDPNVVKVVVDLAGCALYFSRSPVPHVRPGQRFTLLRHVGVYGFTREALMALPLMKSSGLEDAEGLEQLRWLEYRYPTAVLIAQGRPWGIETREDYEGFLARWAARAMSPGGGT